MTDLKVMETIYIHQPTGNVVMGAPADPADERFAAIKVVGVIDLLDSQGFELMDDYAVTSAALKVFLSENPEVTYWSEEKHNFFVSEAARVAYAGGFSTVIVENMS